MSDETFTPVRHVERLPRPTYAELVRRKRRQDDFAASLLHRAGIRPTWGGVRMADDILTAYEVLRRQEDGDIG